MPTIEDTCYARWARGACPCCGSGLDVWADGVGPAAVAEGVILCGRCVASEHDKRPDAIRFILTALAQRSDKIIDPHLGCP